MKKYQAAAISESIAARGEEQPCSLKHTDDHDIIIDKVSAEILNQVGGAGSKIPLKTKADGNCLFNAVSLAVTGSEAHQERLRFWASIELGLNIDRYEHYTATAVMTSTCTCFQS